MTRLADDVEPMVQVAGDADQASRLARFRDRHPEIAILLLGACPTAWIDGHKVQCPTLRGLLNVLEPAVAPFERTSACSGSNAACPSSPEVPGRR